MSTTGRAIPPTRNGSRFRTFLVVAGLIAVIGVADAVRALFWLALGELGGPPGVPPAEYLRVALRLAAWGLLLVVGYLGWKKQVLAPTWVFVALPLLAWALLLVQR